MKKIILTNLIVFIFVVGKIRKRKPSKMPEVRMSDSEEEVSSGHVSRNSLNTSPNRELDTFKHPLQNKWTLWYYKNDRSKDWESNKKQVRIK